MRSRECRGQEDCRKGRSKVIKNGGGKILEKQGLYQSNEDTRNEIRNINNINYMAEKNEKVVKISHPNIYSALSAFQGENPEIKKTKKVDFAVGGGRVNYMYAPLDEFVSTIRPLLAKHGLSFTHEEAGEGKIQCVLYHETSELRGITCSEVSGQPVREIERWHNVIRSMPITVKRAGDMKGIGADSTYARRYTLAEVTGCASDEDNDAPVEVENAKNAVKTLFASFKDKVMKADKKELEERMHIINSELDLIESKKASKFGLTEAQYNELGQLIESRLAGLSVKEDVINTEDED